MFVFIQSDGSRESLQKTAVWKEKTRTTERNPILEA